jgi:hypothetical protein
MKTAKAVKVMEGWRARATVYELSEPLEGHTHVIVSSVTSKYTGPETAIFASTPDGKVMDYTELDGSTDGILDHGEALRNAGYTLITP